MQKGSLVICLANVHNHTWYGHCLCGCSKRQLVDGPNKDEIVTVGDFDSNGDLRLVEYLKDNSFTGFPRIDFKEIQPPISVTELIEESELVNV